MSQTYLPEEEAVNLRNLISVIDNPEKFTSALNKLQAIDSKITNSKAELQNATKIANDAQVALDSKNAEIAKIKADADLVKEQAKISQAQVNKITAELSVRSAELDTKHVLLIQKETALTQKEQDIKQLEALAQQKHSAAAAALEEAAKTKATLDAKLAKLKDLASG